MTTEITVPGIGRIHRRSHSWRVAKVGDPVKVGDVIVELETDKVDVEVNTTAGVIATITQPTGSDVKSVTCWGN